MEPESRRSNHRFAVQSTSVIVCILLAITAVADLRVAQASSHASGLGAGQAGQSSPQGTLGIHGAVSYKGAPISGIYLALRFYNGSAWSNQAITTTAADGSYKFIAAPSLEAGQVYYVRYENGANGNTDNSSYLTAWLSYNISSYSSGADAAGGNFDIADVVMTSPEPYGTIILPFNFQWVKRTATPTDNYQFQFYDSSQNYGIDWGLGYVSKYWMSFLPAGFNIGTVYRWQVGVHAPDEGYGLSRYYQEVTISAITTRFLFLPITSR